MLTLCVLLFSCGVLGEAVDDDQLYMHTWDFTTSIPELMHSLHHFVTSGKLLNLGISNTPAWIVPKANKYAHQKGLTPFSVYEGQWSAAEREIERDVLPMCEDEEMAMAPFSVLRMGYFKMRAQRKAGGKIRTSEKGRNVPFVDKPQKTVVAEALEKIAVARSDGSISIASVALT
jgi:aryl-alcohol dehydrogenase-like predicted oxidoreductase